MAAPLPQIGRFLAAGVLNTVLSYALLLVLLRWMPYLAAYTVAYIAGVLQSYVLMSRFVFGRSLSWGTAVRFPSVYVAQYLVGTVLIWLLVERARLPPWLATGVTVVIVLPLTFLIARRVFARSAATEGADQP